MNKIKDIIFALQGVTPGAWARLGILVAAIVSTALRLFGVETVDFGNENFENAANIVVLVASAAAAYWKNNSFTEAAQAADEVLQIIKNRENV